MRCASSARAAAVALPPRRPRHLRDQRPGRVAVEQRVLLEPLDRNRRAGQVLVRQPFRVFERVYEVQTVRKRCLMAVPTVLVELIRRVVMARRNS